MGVLSLFVYIILHILYSGHVYNYARLKIWHSSFLGQEMRSMADKSENNSTIKRHDSEMQQTTAGKLAKIIDSPPIQYVEII